MQNTKSIKLSIIGMATLLILVLGATYAYLTASITNDNGVTNIAGKTQAIGSISLSNPTSDLKLKVTAKDMLKDKLGIYYATNDSSLNYDTEEVQREIAVATLSGGDASIYYECSAKINIVADGTMLSYLDEGDIYVQFGGLLNNKVDLTNISTDGYLVTFNLNGTDTFTQSVTASVALENKSTDQSDLAGKSLSVEFQNTGFNCNVLKTADITVNSNSNAIFAVENSTGEDLIGYKIYGNSIQNGTPTPTSPVEVQSVGNRTNNLFDFANLTLQGNATITKNSLTLPDGSTTYTSQVLNIDVTGNTQYTLYGIIENNNGSNSGHIAIDCLDGSGTVLKSNIIIYNAVNNAQFKTFTTPANTATLKINIRNRTTDGFTIRNIMLAAGTVSTYEPYGYKIPITVRGKNLFDPSLLIEDSKRGVTVTNNGDGTLTLNGTTTQAVDISLFTNQQLKLPNGYSIKVMMEVLEGSVTTHLHANVSLIIDGSTITNGITLNEDNYGYSATYNVTSDVVMNRFRLTPAQGVTFDNYTVRFWYMIDSDNRTYISYVSPITTNIYLDEPLRKVGNTSDYINFANKSITRNIKAINLKDYNTSGLIYDYEWQGKKSLYFPGVLDNSYTRIPGLSNRNSVFTADATAASSMWIGAGSANLFWLGIYDVLGFTDDETSTAKDKFQTWLSQNPTYVYHATTSPSTLPISLPDIPTFEGTNIIEIGTTVAPSNVDIVYNKDLSK